jgi:hypothetical protein
LFWILGKDLELKEVILVLQINSRESTQTHNHANTHFKHNAYGIF